MQGFVGRESKQIRLSVCLGANIAQIQPKVEALVPTVTQLHTDESNAYHRVESDTREHKTVCHSKKEFARDEDGDGFCEVHCNSCEGLWTGVRNYLRQFRGVSKKYLAQYIAIFENNYNLKEKWLDAIRALIIPEFYLEKFITP